MDNGASSYRRFLDGDESAFDDIMKELFDKLVFFVDRYVHDVHTAEDIAIDAFSELIVHKNRFNFKVSLKTYLFMIGKSRALNYLRHKKVIGIVGLSEVGEVSGEQDLEDSVLGDERKKILNRALSELDEDMRIAVHLVFFEELSYEETAKIMKKNRKQIDNLLYRAKGKLRIILGEEGKQLL